MAEYHNITKEAFAALVEPWGFTLIDMPLVRELVWQKIRPSGVALRIFSGINENGGMSREVGKDAIRISCLYFTPEADRESKGSRKGEHFINDAKRVHRVKGWAANLKKRIMDWREWSCLGDSCPICQSPTIARVVKKPGPNQGKTFYSCCTWNETKCNGTIWPDEEAA